MNESNSNQPKRAWTQEDMLRDAYLAIPPCYGKDFGECPSICPYLHECHPDEDEDFYDPWDNYNPNSHE